MEKGEDSGIKKRGMEFEIQQRKETHEQRISKSHTNNAQLNSIHNTNS